MIGQQKSLRDIAKCKRSGMSNTGALSAPIGVIRLRAFALYIEVVNGVEICNFDSSLKFEADDLSTIYQI